MRSAAKVIVGLGGCALLLGTVAPAASQSDERKPPIYGELPDPRGEQRAGSRVAKGDRGVGSAADSAAATAAPTQSGAARSSPAARPSDPSPSATAVEAVSATPAATHAAPQASLPSGLSSDAPDTAPSIGIGRGKSKGGPSPAATPEPSTLLLMGAGLAGLYRISRRS